MKRPRQLALGCLLVCAGLLASCGGSGGVNTWYVDPLVKLFPGDPAGTNEADADSWWIARNGYANVQLAVRSSSLIDDLTVDLTAPEAGGTALEATARWVGYVPVGSNTRDTPYEELVRDAPALFPDPLREDFPVALEADHTLPIWITVHCPAGATPGDYRGSIALRSGGDTVASSDFTIRVVQAQVPAEQTLFVTNWFNLGVDNLQRFYEVEEYSDSYWQLLENIGRVMADHRQNVILTPVSSLAEPTLAGGRIRFNFDRLDRWVETFERAGVIGTIEGGHLLGRSSGFFSPIVIPAWIVEDGRLVRTSLQPDDPRAERSMREFLGALYAHIRERGWQDHYIQHVHDEPHDREAPIYRRYAQIVHESLPGIPTIDAVGLDQDISFFADVCDIWVPVLGSFDHQLDKIASHVEGGGRAWFYTCVFPRSRYLNRFIDYPLVKTRLLHWFNFRHNLTGFLHWGGNYWGPRPFEIVQTVINSNRTLLPPGDNALVYPNPEKNSILSSIRLEAMRAGIEDYELLTVLAQSDPETARELATTAIPHINDYTRDPAEFRALHRRLLEALQ